MVVGGRVVIEVMEAREVKKVVPVPYIPDFHYPLMYEAHGKEEETSERRQRIDLKSYLHTGARKKNDERVVLILL